MKKKTFLALLTLTAIAPISALADEVSSVSGSGLGQLSLSETSAPAVGCGSNVLKQVPAQSVAPAPAAPAASAVRAES